jgi:AcrR family transcriptional regulator
VANQVINAAHQRTADAITAAAVRLLAERSDASMDEIAQAAGVGRATLYRYFPTREGLVASLRHAAVEDLRQRLADAGLEQCAVEEAVARVVRAVLTGGMRWAFLTRERPAPDESHAGPVVVFIRNVLERGVREGLLRPDLTLDVQLVLFRHGLSAGIELITSGGRGFEETAAAVTAFALDGLGSPSHAASTSERRV